MKKLNLNMTMDMKVIKLKNLLKELLIILERRYLETDSEWKREEISQYQSESNCEKCKGMRLKEEALCVKINKNISEITKNLLTMLKNGLMNLKIFK